MKPARTNIPRIATYILIVATSLVAGAVVWAGCGGDSTAAQSAALSGSQAFVASAAPGARDNDSGETTKVGDITQTRNGTYSYDVEATDSRLSGIFDVVYNIDEPASGASTWWGSWKLTNDEGTWVCDSWRGACDPIGHTFTAGVSRGTGAYEGLLAVWQWYWPLGSGASGALPISAVSGWIQKAEQ